MESLYHQTNRLIQDIQQNFQQLEKQPNLAASIESEIQSKIHTVTTNCEKLDILAFKVPITQRQNAKLRCDQLKYENRHLQSALQMWQQRVQRQQAELSEREQLLSKRFTANPDTSIEIDYSLQHFNSLQNANNSVNDMLMTGNNVLDSLRSQRDTLKGAHKRVIDIANTLGLSNATIRLIERRVKQDKFILIGGMLITTFVIVIVILYI
uniref:Putative golgi snap receptor complex member n=1 Tax=Xenopsylla cheopis TaxID=163159 RepID=A0A6M2DSR1_XENCH